MDIEEAKTNIYRYLQDIIYLRRDKKKEESQHFSATVVMPELLKIELFLYTSDTSQTIKDVSEAADVMERNILKGNIPLLMEIKEEWTLKDFATVLRYLLGQYGLSYR